MTRRLLLLVVLALLLPLPAGAVVSPTVRLTIAHVVKNCHVWVRAQKELGPTTTLNLRRGDRLVIRLDCPMDFNFLQTAGPRLLLGKARTYGGQSRTIVFRSAGVYRLRVTNIQTPEERGLVTLGPPNTMRLTIVVR